MARKISNSQKQNIPSDKLPPQNIEAEENILGSILIDRNAIAKVADLLEPSSFYNSHNQKVYAVMRELFERGEPIDLLTVSNRLREKGILEETGGLTHLTNLVNATTSAIHISHYGKIVHQKRVLRDLISAGYDVAALGWQESEAIDETLDRAEQRIFQVSQRAIGQEFIHLKPELEVAFERFDNLNRNDGKLRGLATGFTDLDNMLAGLQKSDLIILASRPSLGKTSMALDIVRHVAIKEKIPVGVFSLEMSKEQVVDRLISSESGVPLWKLRSGKLSNNPEHNDFLLIRDAMDRLSSSPIFIDDAASPTIMQMRAMARRLQARHGLGLLVVDYLQLIDARDYSENLVQQITMISRGLKSLARELDIPVLTLSQLSRAVEHRTYAVPKLSDLRDSGSLEQDADVVAFIYREDRDRQDATNKNIADILIQKHRNGPVGKVSLYFNAETTSFKNLEKHSENEQMAY